MRNFKNKLTVILSILLVVTCVIGSLAYFTDRITGQKELHTMENGLNINAGSDSYTDSTPTTRDDDLTNWWLHQNAAATANFNPGDAMDLCFTLSNEGTADVKIRETFIITSSVAMTYDGSNRGTPFTLCTATSAASTGGLQASAYSGMTFTKISDTQYKVSIAESSLGANADVEKAYYLVFAHTAGNAWQGKTVTVNYVVEAMQSDGDWATVVTSDLVLNGYNLDVVPAA